VKDGAEVPGEPVGVPEAHCPLIWISSIENRKTFHSIELQRLSGAQNNGGAP